MDVFGSISFNQPLNNWDVSNVKYMWGMFDGAYSFNQPLSNWNTSNVINMSQMFGRGFFNQSLSNWNTSNVTDMSSMFHNNIAFNKPLDSWNTSSVTNMSCMFENANLFNQPLNTWNISNVTDMNLMFYKAISFNQPLSNWNTANVENMYLMFDSAVSFNQNIGDWNISKILPGAVINGGVGIGLHNSGINISNYDSILVGWSAQNIKPNIIIDARNLIYCSASNKRNILITKGALIFGDTLSCTLPISLTSFTATPQQNKVLLQWQTTTETNNNYFTVQRSSNKDNWQDIATIKGAGNSSVVKNYSATDNNPLQGTSYYRIKQTDFNCSISYSETKKVTINSKPQTISVYPNPTANQLHINLNTKATLKMYNAIGKLVTTNYLIQGDNNINIQQLPQGVYMAVIETLNDVVTKRIIKE